MSEQDRIFVKNFSLLITGMAVFTVVIAVVAAQLNDRASRPENPAKLEALEARIAPVGQVYAGDTGRAALAEAQAAAAAGTPAAFDGSLDAAMIYEKVCAACHNSGVLGSPTLEQSAWAGRIDQGMDTLVSHAIEGFQGSAGVMPPKGGRTDLTDEQVKVTVEWMISQLQ